VKIRNLKIRGIRGFNEEREVPLTSGLNLVYAPNGWGKSSLAEAIEWAIFGSTQRRLDAKSKTEFEGSHRNVHFESNEVAFVEMVCDYADQQVILHREIDSAEEETLTVAPQSYSFPETIQTKPIIYQHGLQRFIHTEPKNRWDEFAVILGLSGLENLRDILIKVKNNKEDAIPEETQQFINKLSQIRTKLDDFDILEPLRRPAKQDPATLIVGTAKLGEMLIAAEGGNKDDLKNELENLLKTRQSAVFDLSIFHLRALDETSEQTYSNERKILSAFIENAVQDIKNYKTEKKDDSDNRRANFIRNGLQLLPQDSQACPFCGEDTITPELKETLDKEVQASSRTGELHQKIFDTIFRVRSKIESVSHHFIPRIEKAPTVQAQLPTIRSLLGEEAKDFVDSLEQTTKQIITESAELHSLKQTAINAVDSIESHFDLAEFDEDLVSNHVASIDLFINKADVIKANLSYYESLYTSTKERLENKMSKSEDIAIPELVLEILASIEVITQAFLVEGYTKQLDHLRKKVEKFHKDKTAEKLQEKQDDIQKWYDILNPNEDVGFTGIREHRSRRRWLEILARSYGEGMSGPACLSESHLNAVGISVYLGQILGTNSPLRFVVIDDPVQSMDDKHSTRFSDIVKEILDDGYQIILLSHQNDIINMLRNRFQDNPEFGDLEIVAYDKSGPLIQEKVPPFQNYLDQAKRFRTGDSTCRAAAFNFLRKATERLSKEVYMKGKQTSLPKRYEKLDTEKMEKLLVDSGIPEYKEIVGMKETIKFSGPPSHDDMTQNPPTPEELESHISRLEMYWKRWFQDN